MKKVILYVLPVMFFLSCQPAQDSETTQSEAPKSKTEAPSTFSTEEGITYENLSIYPIKATEGFINKNIEPAKMKSLKEGINTRGFYVTEKKPYGRFEDAGAVNTLTIQNKSEETIYLMQGDVVQGGNQDRVIAQNLVVPPRTITDIEVYCVEKGRWKYREEDIKDEDPEAKKKRKIYAFSGYYHVASSELRKTVRETKNQANVWEKVGELTLKNNGGSTTGTYTALEGSDKFTEQRDAYLEFFNMNLKGKEDCVGMIAISGTQILGADIFGHPSLFQKKYQDVLHGYITDAVSSNSKATITEKSIQKYIQRLNKDFDSNKKAQENSDEFFQYKGQVVHFSKL